MLKHCVFLNCIDPISEAEYQDIAQALQSVAKDVPGMLDYGSGPNLDYEGKSSQFDLGLVMTFTDRAAHLQYENHPVHKKLGAKLVTMSKGGLDGIVVFDINFTGLAV